MAELLPMLALSPTMEQATIVKWNKSEGDNIISGDTLCEVETDKAVMEYESTTEGTLLKVLVGEGQTCGIGDPIAIIGAAGEDISAILAQVGAKQTAAGEIHPAHTAGEKAHIAPAAEAREVEQPIEHAAPVSAQAEVAAPEPGVSKPFVRVPAVTVAEPPQAPGGQAQPRAAVPHRRAPVSPVARRMADEAGIDVAAIKGTGPEGRITKRDVEEAIAAGGSAHREAAPPAAAPVAPHPRPAPQPEAAQHWPPAAPPVAAPPAPPLVQKTAAPPAPVTEAPAPPAAQVEAKTPELVDQVVPLSQMRRAIAARMSQSAAAAPHFYLTVSVAMDELMAARQRLNDSLGRKVSFNAFLIKFVAEALARHPRVNASWEEAGIHLRGRADIALAVALEDGLIAPIIRDCSRKGLLAIDGELTALVCRAQGKRIAAEELEGATFTISNLGNAGVEEFTAVINPPGACTLAVGKIAKVPVADENDSLHVRSMMKLTLSCDHRIIDGAVGAAFLAELKRLLENPVQPMLVVQL